MSNKVKGTLTPINNGAKTNLDLLMEQKNKALTDHKQVIDAINNFRDQYSTQYINYVASTAASLVVRLNKSPTEAVSLAKDLALELIKNESTFRSEFSVQAPIPEEWHRLKIRAGSDVTNLTHAISEAERAEARKVEMQNMALGEDVEESSK